MIKDNEKFNNAALLGWRILKFTPQQFKNGEAAEILSRMFWKPEPQVVGPYADLYGG
jgi:hypothetical protein